MTEKNRKALSSQLARLAGLALPWLEVLVEVWKIGRKTLRGFAAEGMYEVLDFDFHLELKDPRGKVAVFHKREKVRFLQDNVIAYQDQAWGDGELFADYKCTPGVPVDCYKDVSKYRVLISLRETKNRGDKMEIRTERKVRNGFVRDEEYMETEISHPMKRAQLRVTFPHGRPPKRVVLIEHNVNRTHTLDNSEIEKLPDGRFEARWRTNRPRLYETYLLRWRW